MRFICRGLLAEALSAIKKLRGVQLFVQMKEQTSRQHKLEFDRKIKDNSCYRFVRIGQNRCLGL